MGKKRGNNFPFALVEKILLRLPVESLVRFKCVCKSWFTLFNNPTFISQHLSKSIMVHDTSYYLLLRLWLTPFTHQLFSLSHSSSSLKQISIAIPNMNTTSLSNHIISNPCNGLVCLYSDFHCGRDVFLCNPTTREIRLLPPSNLVTKVRDGMVLGVGMGHGDRINDCKVVRLWVSYRKCRCNKIIVEEYGLSSDSWRIIESANPWWCEFETSCFALHFKGIYYWWAKLIRESNDPTLLALNVGGGMFQKVRLPKKIDISSNIGRYLGVLNDSLSLVCRNCCDQNANFDIYVMNIGVGIWGYSWTKLRTIEHSASFVPLVFWKGNELLVKMFDMVRSYNVDNEEIRNVNIEDEGRGIADVCEAMFCVKSLVSIRGEIST